MRAGSPRISQPMAGAGRTAGEDRPRVHHLVSEQYRLLHES